MEFESVIKARESIRSYSNKNVEDEKITFVLESARLAPSWRNRQCWQFVVVKDKKNYNRFIKNQYHKLLVKKGSSNYCGMW